MNLGGNCRWVPLRPEWITKRGGQKNAKNTLPWPYTLTKDLKNAVIRIRLDR